MYVYIYLKSTHIYIYNFKMSLLITKLCPKSFSLKRELKFQEAVHKFTFCVSLKSHHVEDQCTQTATSM